MQLLQAIRNTYNKQNDSKSAPKYISSSAALMTKSLETMTSKDVYKFLPHNNRKKIEMPKDQEFDCEKFVKPTDQERRNLFLLSALNQFKWFVESHTIGLGQSIGGEALERSDESTVLYYDNEAICSSRNVCVAYLRKEHFAKIVERIKHERIKEKIQMIKQIPFFQNIMIQ